MKIIKIIILITQQHTTHTHIHEGKNNKKNHHSSLLLKNYYFSYLHTTPNQTHTQQIVQQFFFLDL